MHNFATAQKQTIDLNLAIQAKHGMFVFNKPILNGFKKIE
jgi:hypothetical protein